MLGGVQGVAVDRQGVGEVAGKEVAVEDFRQSGGVAGPALASGLRGDGYQRRAFGVQPGAGGVRVGDGWYRGGGRGMRGRRRAAAGYRLFMLPAAVAK